MALDTRRDLFDVELNVDTTQIYPTSRLVSRITGMNVQANKAIVGENAFRHASGIHQDGVLKDRSTYEVMKPERVGLPPDVQLVLGKLSGRAGLQARLEALGYALNRDEVTCVYQRFLELADKKSEITDPRPGILDGRGKPLRLGAGHLLPGIRPLQQTATATSPPPRSASSALTAACRPTPLPATAPWTPCAAPSTASSVAPAPLADFQVQAVSEGIDSVGSVTMRIENAGRAFSGRSANTDIIVASAQAYLSAVNRMLAADEAAALPPIGATPD